MKSITFCANLPLRRLFRPRRCAERCIVTLLACSAHLPSTAALPATLEGPKPKGSSSSMLRSIKSSGLLAMMTFSSGPPNSNRAWRHTPQGEVICLFTSPRRLPTTAISVNSVTPSATALNRAVRSAQLVGVKAAFSTLQPVKMRPSLARRAAPTMKSL